MKTLITLLLAALLHFTSFATTYTSSGDKSWSASGFPNPVSASDTISIENGDSVWLTLDVNIQGYIVIDTNAIIGGANKLKLLAGTLINYGLINISNELHVDGEFYNYSAAYVQKLHSDGFIHNTSLIKLEPGEEFKHHGGEVEGCGTILADYVNISNNIGVSLNGQPAALTTCQNFCNVAETDTPSYNGEATLSEFLNNTDTAHSQISSPVSICGPSALPVDLIHFDVSLSASKWVDLSWTTASEKNNARFEVERSRDGQIWELVTVHDGAGTSHELHNYTATDYHPLSGEQLYRLKQVDYDGSINYSEVRFIDNAVVGLQLTAYPNPAHDKIKVVHNGTHLPVLVFSMTGQDLSQLVTAERATDDSQTVDISALSTGMYILAIGEQQVRFNKK